MLGCAWLQGSKPYDPTRTLRMFGFGLVLYGPLQHHWWVYLRNGLPHAHSHIGWVRRYNLLDWLMPIKTTATFLAKVRVFLRRR